MRKKRLLIAFLVVALGLSSATPSLLSTKQGTALLLRFLNRKWEGTLSIETLSLNWTQSQTASNITFHNTEGKLIFSSPSLTSTAPLWKILFLSNCGTTHLVSPNCILQDTMLQTAWRPSPSMRTASLSPSLLFAIRSYSGTFLVDHGTLHLQSSHLDPIAFQEIEIKAVLSHFLDLSLHCTTLQQEIPGKIDLIARIEGTSPLITAQGSITSLPVRGIDQLIAQFHPQLNGLWLNLLGATIDLDGSCVYKPSHCEFDLAAKSPQFSAQLSMHSEGGMISLKNPGLIKVTLPPPSFLKFSHLFPALKPLMLQKPVTLLLNIAELSMPPPQKIEDFRAMHVDFTLSTDSPSFWSINEHPITATQISLHGSSPCFSKELMAQVDLNLASAQHALSCQLSTTLDPARILTLTGPVIYKRDQSPPIQCDLEQCQIAFQPFKLMGAANFPLKTQPLFSALFGSSLQCKFKLDPSQSIYLDLRSPSLSFNTVCFLKDQILTSRKADGEWTLTESSYPVLDQILTGKASPFQLKQPATFRFHVTDACIPLNTPKDWRLNIAAQVPLLEMLDTTTQETLSLSQSTVSFSPQEWNLSSTLQMGASSGSIYCTGHLNSPPNTPLSDLEGRFQIKATQFPTRFLDILARIQGNTQSPFSTLFGKTLDTICSIDLNHLTGPVTLSIQSAHTQLSLDGKCESGSLLLHKPFTLKTKITPEISCLLVNKSLQSQDPVLLEISPTGSSIPFYPFDAKNFTIPHAKLLLGKINCRNEGNVSTTLKLLKADNNSKDLMLWFAPIDCSIKSGLIDFERTEILINQAWEIALWGKTNLVKDKVDMVLGLPAATLSRAFGIDKLPADYVLTIPIRGSIQNVEIDSGKASAKIAMLLAWQHKDLVGKNPAGAIFGEVLGQLAQLPDKDVKVPPARHPFPWETSRSPKKEAKPSKKRHFTLKEKPLKQLLKVIR